MEIYGNYIYGSSDSTDIDIAYIVDKLPSLNECKIFCSSDKNENRNLITIDDGIISNCYKGTKDELNNNMSKEDILKLIAFQSGQCLGLINGDEYFTKKEISLAYPELSKFIFRIEDTDISILNTFVHNFVNVIKNIEYRNIDNNTVLFIKEDIIIELKTERINND